LDEKSYSFRNVSNLSYAPEAKGVDSSRDIPGTNQRGLPVRSLCLCGETIFLIFCLFLVWGCGYQLTGSKTHVPPGITSIAIPTFVNQTFEPGVEIQFTRAFLNDFITDKRVKVVDKAQADSVLEGTIKFYRLSSSAYNADGYVLEYEATMVVDLVLRSRNGEILWKENNLSEKRWFRTSSGVLLNEGIKSAAIQDIGHLVAERVRNRFFYNF
jgi:outer membrane lipopolysaccharide assembly protein LptE/RlpB